MKSIFVFTTSFFLSFVSAKVNAEIVGSTNYNSKTYFIDVLNKSSSNSVKAEVWFRESKNASSVGDFKITELKANTDNLSHYIDLVCRGKEYYDGNKTILGCLATIGSAFCAVATVSTDGAMAFICETTWTYTADKGAADCLEGSSDAIAKFLGKEKEWKALSTTVLLIDPKLAEAISKSIDFMCDDIKDNKKINSNKPLP